MIARLCKIRAAPMGESLIAAALGNGAFNPDQAIGMRKAIGPLEVEARRVERARQALADIPSLAQRGSHVL